MATATTPPPPPKYNCKLCSRSFTNAKSIGGHMKAHLAKLKLSMPPKTIQQAQPMSDSSSSSQDLKTPEFRVNVEEKAPSSSSSAYGLRENPRKSFRFADPEVFTCDPSLVLIHDRESETESKTLTRVRSKRTRKTGSGGINTVQGFELKKEKLELPGSDESMPETEPMSSVSDTTPEEEVALSLMMLSRDNRVRVVTDDKVEFRKVYQCEVCYKVFRSSQALGGHRITHRKNNNPVEKAKKPRVQLRPMRQFSQDTTIGTLPEEIENTTRTRACYEVERDDGVNDRIYECPFCQRVFCSGQALGGHKRSHLITPSSSKFDTNSIDLNIAATMEDEDCSVVSDAEHFDPIEKSY